MQYNADHKLSEVTWCAALLATGVFFLVTSGSIRDSMAVGNGDPGPRAIPVTISYVLIAGGILSLLLTFSKSRPDPVESDSDAPSVSKDRIRIAFFCGLTFCYIACVPFAFYTSSYAFVLVAVWWFGAKWWSALVAASAITAVVWLLFVRLFLVPLPTLLETLSRQ